jgi:hypothetical protein
MKELLLTTFGIFLFLLLVFLIIIIIIMISTTIKTMIDLKRGEK